MKSATGEGTSRTVPHLWTLSCSTPQWGRLNRRVSKCGSVYRKGEWIGTLPLHRDETRGNASTIPVREPWICATHRKLRILRGTVVHGVLSQSEIAQLWLTVPLCVSGVRNPHTLNGLPPHSMIPYTLTETILSSRLKLFCLDFHIVIEKSSIISDHVG